MSAGISVALWAAVQRIARSAPRRGLVVPLLAALLAAGSLAAAPVPASAAGIKVVIVVGPAGSLTSSYLSNARAYAAQARSYGATVVEVYTPNATWSRVRSAAQGANLLIYLGHGNGYPNPYHSTLEPKKVDGFGLNPYAGSGNTRTAYYGEYYVKTYIKLAPNAVVILNHACYSAGNSEPGRANPTLSVARQRVDNFGAGFLRAGARAVFAEVRGSAAFILRGLFTTSRTMNQVFWSGPDRTYTYRAALTSKRTPGATGWLDPYQPGRYYRSVVGQLSMTAAAWRSAVPAATPPVSDGSAPPTFTGFTGTSTVRAGYGRTIGATVSDDRALGKLAVRVDGRLARTWTLEGTTATRQVLVSATWLPRGRHSIAWTAWDAAGNVHTRSYFLYVE